MTLKPKSGYKIVKRSFGKCEEIPEMWELDKIQNHVKITTGSRNTQDKIETGKYPFFVRSKNIEKINSYSYDGEAVLTVGDGRIGEIFHYVNGKFDFHQRVYKISNFDQLLDGYFFYLYFSTFFLHRAKSMTAKNTVDSVRMNMITEMLIPLPPILEQQKIASILSEVDALIESTQKLIEKIKMLKKGLMQKLFTQGIDKTSIILSRLDSIIFLQRGHDLPNHKRRIGKIPVIGSNGIVGYHNESKSNGPGVLIGRSGTLGKVYYAEEDYWPLNTSLYVKEFYSSFPKFVFYLLQDLDYKKFNAGTSVPTLNRNHLHPFKLKIPININEQQKIASILSGVDALRHHNIVALIILHIKLAIFLTLFVRILGSWIQQYRKKPTPLS